MKKLIKKNFVFLALFFTFLTASALGDEQHENIYMYKFLASEESQISQIYKILSLSQTEDYLFLELDEITPEERAKVKKACFLKTVLSQKDMKTLSKFAMLAFSFQDLAYDSVVKEPIDPVAPLPAPLPYYEDPLDPIAPLPAPLPYYEDPLDPIAPLPAPLPYYEDPLDPIAPLPAPLPYYEEPDVLHPARKQLEFEQIPSIQVTPLAYIIRDRDGEGSMKKTILKIEEISWSNNVGDVLGLDFPLIESCEE